MVTIIPLVFYSYTALSGKSIFAIDISSFVVAVIIGQLLSYKVLTYRQLTGNLNKIAVAAFVLLALAFIVFTYYPHNYKSSKTHSLENTEYHSSKRRKNS